MNFTLVSGYYCKEPWKRDHALFRLLWFDMLQNVDGATQKVIIANGDSMGNPDTAVAFGFEAINLRGNLGHLHNLIGKEEPKKPHRLCGWSACVLAGAMVSYMNETDFLWFEQDVLAFGPWAERMYADMGDGNMVFGGPMKTAPFMAAAQSLFLVRHAFIPDFVSNYIMIGSEQSVRNIPESKFASLRQMFGPRAIRHLSFGCDRERPIPYDAEVFYAQKITEEEHAELLRRQLTYDPT